MRMELEDHSIKGNPAEIITDLRQRFIGTNETIHKRLGTQAQNTTFKAGMKVKYYMNKQKHLRLQMLQSEFPNINN